MWDTIQSDAEHLSHDPPCPRCGHGPHTYLACGDGCDCPPATVPGATALAAA